MVKNRKNKYIFVVAMALCFVMVFSVSAFAASEPFYLVGTQFRNNTDFNILDGFTVITDVSLWDDIKSYAQASLSTNYLLSIQTGVESFYNTHYLVSGGSGGFGRLSASERLAIDNNINIFSAKQVQYITTQERDKVYCDYLGNVFLYISDGSVSPTYNINLNLQQSITSIAQNYFVSVTEQITETTVNNFYKEIQNIVEEEVTQYITEVYNNTVNSTTIEKQIINPTTNQFYDFSNDTTYDIEGITFDNDNRSYTLSVSADNNYYDYSVTYYNEYTYIMYLGSSEEYQPRAYKLYYELPDGRSSADLTADELAGMSVQFADVVTYDRAASDEVVEGLWHLDGSLENTAFNNNSQMYFNSGASISYIEDAGFEGALYLPALNGAREWWNNIGISTDNGTVLPQSVQDYFSSIFSYPHDQLYSSNVKSYNINDNSFNFSVDFRFYNYADANDSTGTMFTYEPYFNRIYETSRSPFVGTLDSSSLRIFKIDFLGSSLKFYNQNGTNTTTVSYSPGTWNHILVNYSFQLGRYGMNSSVGGTATYSITYLPSVTVYLNGVLVYSFESTSDSVTAINNTFQSSTNYNTAVNYFVNGNKFPSALQGVKFSSTSNTVPFAIDEIRITDTNVPNLVSPVPYEDNLVWVLPDSTNLAANTLAIQSDYLSGKYRVGGIRPSMVEKGHVWFQISMNRIVSCQVYNGIMWEEVNCYVWTGSRWIPANYFDVVTLTDYYDIADNTGLPTITTSEGFFSWFQREFKDFKDAALNYFEAWEGGEYGAGGTTNNNTTIIAPSLTANGTLDANISIDNKFEFDLGTNAGDVLQGGFESVSGVFRGMWQLGGDVFGSISEGVTFIFDFLTPTGSSDFINNPVDFWFIGID